MADSSPPQEKAPHRLNILTPTLFLRRCTPIHNSYLSRTTVTGVAETPLSFFDAF